MAIGCVKTARVGNSNQGRGANSDYLMPLSQARRNGDFARKKVARCPLWFERASRPSIHQSVHTMWQARAAANANSMCNNSLLVLRDEECVYNILFYICVDRRQPQKIMVRLSAANETTRIAFPATTGRKRSLTELFVRRVISLGWSRDLHLIILPTRLWSSFRNWYCWKLMWQLSFNGMSWCHLLHRWLMNVMGTWVNNELVAYNNNCGFIKSFESVKKNIEDEKLWICLKIDVSIDPILKSQLCVYN